MISVIIPAYNVEKTIEKALTSILRQEYDTEFEIIIINDGSTDNTEKVVHDFIAKNPEATFIFLQQENKGVSATRNAGLKIAKGEYIALLDADDEWYPEKTKKQMHYLEDKNYTIDFLASCRNHEKIKFPYRINPKNNLAKITLKKMLIRNIAQPSTVIFKRDVMDSSGFFDEQQRYAEDANYWLRISKSCNMYILNEDLTLTGSGKKSFGVSGLSANLWEMEKGFRKNLKEIYQNHRLNLGEYIFFFAFQRLKYYWRLIRVNF
ncbi:glycosyltransferase family 2 protein [Elizabethkingia sp. JS20170427COW]|uniref:glycosyltransferase family 2 protein n=1 Tax=Elizabethkingia sp. JS20170427COW TaxID=2583851 RepID=UPI00111054F1|nr:glycosyltransferase family 2 protein [Elizabethkingia sp. JS20170427COW]QCX53880.1 glycosyltransferase family 2 protein [Elizabethkingia sp. JS20170427COW]